MARSAIAENHRQRSRHPIVDPDGTEPTVQPDGGGPTALEIENAAYLVPLISRLP